MALYGFRPFSQTETDSNLEYRTGKNSEVFALYDPVAYDGAGYLKVAAAGNKIVGVCMKTVTMASDNVTVAKVQVPFTVWRPGDKFLAESDAALEENIVGCYMDITGTTGAIQINGPTGSTSAGAVILKKIDPRGTGSTTEVLVEIAEPAELAFAQA